jgi:four helix bundle protein
MDTHRRLIAWQRCRELAGETYRVTVGFPPSERFGLTSQLRRAAVSAAANIAEGYARYGRAELAHALSVSLGSLAEMDTLLEIANDIGYVTPESYAELSGLRKEASRVTFGLQRKVRR